MRRLIPLLLILLPACDDSAQHRPGRSAAVALSTARDTYLCPEDAGEDGYLAAPVPVGMVSASAWACYPTSIGGGTFSAGCSALDPVLLINAAKQDNGAGDYLYIHCAEGEIRIDWLLLAD